MAGRHIHRGFRESVRGPNCEFSKIETAKPVDKALEGRRMHPFTAAEDGFDPSKVEPGQVVIYCFCCRQFEGEVRCRRKRLALACHQLQPPGWSLQKRHRACEHSAASYDNRRTNSQNQTHVMIER